MSSPVIDHARPTISAPDGTVAEKITLARRLLAAMPQSPEWASAPALQSAAADWSTETDELDATHTGIAQLEGQLQILRAKEASLCRDWTAKKNAVVGAVDTHCSGSADKVRSLSCDVAQRNERPLAETPEGLHGKRSEVVGRATAQWVTRGGVHNLFFVQHASNSADPTTVSPPILWTRGTFTLDGQTPGAIVYVRVAAADTRLPGGQTAYTSWVAVQVSA